MKVVNSLKTLKTRDRNNRLIRRKGRVYIINKTVKVKPFSFNDRNLKLPVCIHTGSLL